MVGRRSLTYKNFIEKYQVLTELRTDEYKKFENFFAKIDRMLNRVIPPYLRLLHRRIGIRYGQFTCGMTK